MKNLLVIVMAHFVALTSFAYPVDPAKVPVDDVDLGDLETSIVLAYDSDNKNIVYYAPQAGRIATMNGTPLFGFIRFSDGTATVNASMTFDITGEQREKLFNAIRKENYIPVKMPYRKTKVVPYAGALKIDGQTRLEACIEEKDPETGEITSVCEQPIFSSVSYIKDGPTLGENVNVSYRLTPMGALAYQTAFGQAANAMSVGLVSDYWAAGTAFKAQVTVNYKKFFEQFHAYAAYHDGRCVDIEIETFFRNSATCKDIPREECGIFVRFWDDRGNEVTSVTMDPDNKVHQEGVFGAVERFMQEQRDKMFEPLGPVLNRADTSKPAFGFKLSAKYERRMESVTGVVEFAARKEVLSKQTNATAVLGCIEIPSNGPIRRQVGGDCRGYWDGTANLQEFLADRVDELN